MVKGRKHDGRTLICSVVFADLVEYSRKSVPEQVAARREFHAALAPTLEGIAPGDRVLIDTGDGAALGLLGDPEDALFVSMSLRECFAARNGVLPRSCGIRLGINLGPIQLIEDANGAPALAGDGINVAQRVMSFAQPGQILASRSYRDVVSCLSADFSGLFAFDGVRADKYVREHEVYAIVESEAAFARVCVGVESRSREEAAPRARIARAVIADDEPILRDELREWLANIWPELQIVAVAGDGISAVREIEKHHPDIAFLDIQMPGMTGLEVARTLNGLIHVVFVTAYDQYAIRAFEEGAADYVLKPFGAPRLVAVCQRIKRRLGHLVS